ncbi:MAG: hypothetical protein A4E37_02162 [Methanoregulaceae archaeon PtaB.Bin056]|jgi:hypothetical protein|nr:MAG: hypothetical protein A4E37_02162 [Methanoregulaceae archaeon PtaB.Bin056]
MPEVTDDERGRRMFKIHQEMAVEKAIEKIRLNLGADWKIYSAHDIELLKYILGECWGSLDRRKWEQVTFTRLSKDAVDAIIRVAKEVKREERLESDAIQEVIGLLQRIP